MKLSIKALAILCLLSSGFVLHAQNNAKINGKLLNAITSKPVEFATIALFRLPDSTLVNGVTSDTSGLFAFNNLTYGDYALKISCLSYKKTITDKIKLIPENPNYSVGSLNLEEDSKAIKEVAVIGERLKGEETVDRTVYTVPESALKAAGSGTDILKRIPSVQVDLSNNISLQGSSNIIITVDGKERDNNYVSQIDPKSIDKVEVITNPSSKYDASVTGVINIILKKEKRLGINGDADLEIPTNTNHFITSPHIGIDYGYNKMHFFTSVSGHAEGFNSIKEMDRTSGDNLFTGNGNGKFKYITPTLHYGFDYFFNDRNTFNFYGNYNPSKLNMDYSLDKSIYEKDVLSNFFTTEETSHDKRSGSFYSAFYKKAFTKPGNEFTVDISYYMYDSKTTNTYLDQYYLTDMITRNGDPVYRDERLNLTRKSLNTKIDYALPFKENYIFEAGYQNYAQWLDNSFDFGDAGTTNFKYREIRNAAYARLGGKYKKLNAQAGVRAEFSDITIDEKNSAGYSCLLPNASIQYTLDKRQSLKLSYRRAIVRPGSDDLNPFVTRTDSMNISHGNPDLKPSYNDQFKLTLSKNFGSSFISPELFFTRNTDVFQEVTKVNDKNVSERFVDNVGNGYEYGLGLSGSIQATKWLTLNPYVRMYQQHVEGNSSSLIYGIPNQDHFAWQASMYATCQLPKGFVLWTYATYTSPSAALQTTNYRDALYIIALEKNILKDKAKIGINYYEPFYHKFRFNRTVSQGTTFRQDDDNHVDLGVLVSLKFTYRFSYGKEVKKLDRQKNLENDGKGGLN